jgi:hypothetical protein
VAGAVNGLGPERGRAWLDEQAAAATGSPRLTTADRVGQVRPEDTALDEWQPPLAAAPLALGRVAGACAAERRAEAPFSIASPWAADTASAAFQSRCDATPTALLLARLEAWEGEDARQTPQRAVQIANATGARIDLERDGYVLEVYAEGEREPARIVPLKGELAHGATLKVATSDAPPEARDQALIADDLTAPRLDAVVLRRLAAGAGGMCRNDVYAAVVEVGTPPIVMLPLQPIGIDGEPRTDESPIDPDRGGDLASPN